MKLKIKELIFGKPIKYTGFNCGCCGKWVDKEFIIYSHKSCGAWWDTIGICEKCKNC